MVDPLFFIGITISFIAFGVHSALAVHYARRYDALVVASYRGLSLVVTMAPILFFTSFSEVIQIREHVWILVLSAVTGATAFTISMTGSRYLPIGVASSIRQSATVPVAIGIGMLFLGEYLTLLQILIIAGIAVCVTALTWLRSEHAHIDSSMAMRGIFLSILAGCGGAFSWYFFSILARDINPLVAAYFVESGIGVVTALFLILSRKIGTHRGIVRIPVREMRNIVLIATLTIPATVSYSIAINHGPYPLASGLMMGTVLVATLAGWIFFKEHLRRPQILLILVVVILMALLRLYS